MEVKLTNVFRRNAEALLAALNGTGPRLIINQGGQGSSKTYSILQVIYNILLGSDEPIRTTLTSYALPHLKQGVCSDMDRIIESFGGNLGEIKSSPEKPVYRIHKSKIVSYGIEGNLALAHGPRRELLYVNECNHKVSYQVFDHLFSRSGITIVDFNPDQEFWLHEKVIPNFHHVLIKSNYLDNPYLSEGELQNILMKKDKPGFENWWRVYGEGELGKLEGAILSNYRFALPGEIEEALTYLPAQYGLDFGYHPDPDAMVKVAIDERRKKIYVQQKIYATNNGTGDLIKTIRTFYKDGERIIAESAQPRTIADLSKYFNIEAVRKTRSVADWLRVLQNYEIIISEDSVNLSKELKQYIWNDKKAGIPIDAFNHLIDAIRYVLMMQSSGSSILMMQEF